MVLALAGASAGARAEEPAAPATPAAPAAPAAPATPAIESVVVTARHLQVETLIDRKVYSVAADVQSTFGSVSDVLTVDSV